MTWTYWMILGLTLLGLEAAVSGVILVFFGLGALCAALAHLLNFSLEWQISIFVLTSILFLFAFRNKWKKQFLQNNESKISENPMEELIGQTGKVVQTIETESSGRVDVQGSTWTAFQVEEANKEANEKIEIGSFVQIISYKGTALIVQKKNPHPQTQGMS